MRPSLEIINNHSYTRSCEIIIAEQMASKMQSYRALASFCMVYETWYVINLKSHSVKTSDYIYEWKWTSTGGRFMFVYKDCNKIFLSTVGNATHGTVHEE